MEAEMQSIEKVIVGRSPELMISFIDQQFEKGISSEEIREGLVQSLETIRQELGEGTFSIPEFLLTIDVFKAGVDYLNSCSDNSIIKEDRKRVLIGVVEGDVHDLGKNIVAAVLDACGYEMIDAGKEVSAMMFLSGIKKYHPSIIALSSMMSTSLENMKVVIQQIKRDYPKIQILVGGASVDKKISQSIGSDGFADSALTAPDEVKRLLQSI